MRPGPNPGDSPRARASAVCVQGLPGSVTFALSLSVPSVCVPGMMWFKATLCDLLKWDCERNAGG